MSGKPVKSYYVRIFIDTASALVCVEGVLITFDTLKRLPDKAGVTYVTEQ